jgi:hypothetical protein
LKWKFRHKFLWKSYWRIRWKFENKSFGKLWGNSISNKLFVICRANEGNFGSRKSFSIYSVKCLEDGMKSSGLKRP